MGNDGGWFLLGFLIITMAVALVLVFVFTEAYPGEKTYRKQRKAREKEAKRSEATIRTEKT